MLLNCTHSWSNVRTCVPSCLYFLLFYFLIYSWIVCPKQSWRFGLWIFLKLLLKSCFYHFCQIPDLSSFWQFHVYKEILIWNLSVCLCWEDSLIVVCMQARAAFQGGLRKGNARERFVPSNNNRYGLENRRREQLTNSSDSSRYIILKHVDNHFSCKKKKKESFLQIS